MLDPIFGMPTGDLCPQVNKEKQQFSVSLKRSLTGDTTAILTATFFEDMEAAGSLKYAPSLSKILCGSIFVAEHTRLLLGSTLMYAIAQAESELVPKLHVCNAKADIT